MFGNNVNGIMLQ